MVPLKESSKNVVVHIILTLILLLFSRANARWRLECRAGAPKYIFNFENSLYEDVPGYDMKRNEMTVNCEVSVGNGNATLIGIVKPNPEASLTVCDVNQSYQCKITVQYFDNRFREVYSTKWYRYLDIVPNDDKTKHCKEEKHCHWQLLKDTARLYSPTENKYLEYRYLRNWNTVW